MDSSFGRKSDRPKRKKRSFSPDVDIAALSMQAVHKRKKKKQHVLPPSYGANRPYDRLANGMPFCCDLCKSPYVCNPLMSKRGSRTKRSKHQPCPRIKFDPVTGRKLTLCNACGLALDRPKQAKRTPRPTLTEEDKKKYLAEAKRFAATLAKDLKEPDVSDLFCPTIKRTPCKCLQRYILRGSTKEDCGVKARLLVSLLKEARRLATLKSYDITQMTMTGRRGKKYRNIGLGNGQKRSKQYENFVMAKRLYLRNDLELCERATQKVLCYSNNFLHKKLKTEERGCRIERVRGKCALGQLTPLAELYKHHCCIDMCVRMSLTHLLLLEQWRERAQTGQAEARRVLAEMLTPSGGIRLNCYKFISMVTGCSPSTVCKVNDQMRETGGEREPPVHGLRKYWLTCTLKGKTMDVSSPSTVHMEPPDTPASTISQSTDQSNQESEVTSTTSCLDQASNSAEQDLNSDVQREKLLQLQQQLLQQQKNIQEQQRIVQAQLLQHTLIQHMSTTDESQQTLLQQLSISEGSPEPLIQQMTKPDGSHPLIQQLTKPDGSHPLIQQMTKPDGSHPLIQQMTKPDGSHPLIQQMTKPDGSHPLIQQMTKPDGSHPQIQQLSKPDSSQQALPQQIPKSYESQQVGFQLKSTPDGLPHILLQPLSKPDVSPQALLQLSTPDGSALTQSLSKPNGPSQTLTQPLSKPDGSSQTIIQSLSKPDGSQQAVFQLRSSEGSKQALLQPLSKPDGSQQALLQPLSKPDGSQPPLIQLRSSGGPSQALLQQLSKPDGTQPALFQLRSSDGSQQALLQQLSKPDGSQQYVFQQLPSKVGPSQQTMPQIISEKVATHPMLKPDGSLQALIQQLSKSDPSNQAFLQPIPVSDVLQHLSKPAGSQQVVTLQMSQSNEAHQVPIKQFRPGGLQQVMSPQIQTQPDLTRKSAKTLQDVTGGHAVMKQYQTTTVSAPDNSQQTDPHLVTKQTQVPQAAELKAVSMPQNVNVNIQKSSQVPQRGIHQSERNDRQVQSSSSGPKQTEQSDESEENMSSVPFMLLHNRTQHHGVRFPVTSAPTVFVSDNSQQSSMKKLNPSSSGSARQSENNETCEENRSAIPLVLLPNVTQNQGLPVSIASASVVSKLSLSTQTQAIPESSQVHILQPGAVQMQKQNQRTSLSLSEESANSLGRMGLPVMLIQNMGKGQSIPFSIPPIFSSSEKKVSGHSVVQNQAVQFSITPASSTADKAIISNHHEPVQQSSVPFVTINPASVAPGGSRIQILSPVNLQQIQEMMGHGQVQPNCSLSSDQDSNVMHFAVSTMHQNTQRQKRQIVDDSSLMVPQSKNLININAGKNSVISSLSNHNRTMAVSSPNFSTKPMIHTADKTFSFQTERVLSEIPPAGLQGSSHGPASTTVVSSSPATQSAETNTAQSSRSQNLQNTFHTMAATNNNSTDSKVQRQKQGHPSELASPSLVIDPSSFIHIDSKLGRQHLQYSLEPGTNSPLFLQPVSPVMESLSSRQIQHFLSSDDLSRPISARTIDFDFSCSPLTVSDRDSIFSRSRNSSGESIEPTISLDTSTLPRELLQLFIQQGIPFTISNGQQQT